MTLLLTSGSKPYHTSVEHTAPPTGGAGPTKKTTGPTPQRGRGRGETRPNGESNKAKQDNYPLDRQGGIPWGGGGGGGVWQPCIIYGVLFHANVIYYLGTWTLRVTPMWCSRPEELLADDYLVVE